MNQEKILALQTRLEVFQLPLDPSQPVSRTNPMVGAVFWRAIVAQEKEKAKRYKKVEARAPPSFTSPEGRIEGEDLAAALLFRVPEAEVEACRAALGIDAPVFRPRRAKRTKHTHSDSTKDIGPDDSARRGEETAADGAAEAFAEAVLGGDTHH